MPKPYLLLVSLGSYSIVLAAVIALIRFKKIPAKYHPFVFLVWLALLNEMLSTFLIYRIRNNAINSNIYVLCEFLLALWLFDNLGLFHKKRIYYQCCLFLMPLIWLLDSVVTHPLNQFSSVFRILYSFTLVLFSIDYINYVFFSEKENILRNTGFLICLAFLIYFSFKGLLEIFYLFRLKPISGFYRSLLLIINILNLVANLIYAFAMLWIRKKETYTSPY